MSSNVIYQIIWVVFVAVAFAVVYYIKYRQNGRGEARSGSEPGNRRPSAVESGSTAAPSNTAAADRRLNTGAMVRKILESIPCDYEVGSDEQIFFTYQGEHFGVYCSGKSSWIRILDFQWFDCPLDDLDQIAAMQKSINLVNCVQACTAFYSYQQDDHKFIVLSKYDTILDGFFEQAKGNFLAWLDAMFQLKRDVVREFDKERMRCGADTK